MYQSLYTFLLLMGGVQGLIMGILLLKSKSTANDKAHRYLAIMLFFFAYRLLIEALYDFGLGGVDHWTYHIFLEYNWVYGSLIFFYIKSVVNPSFQLTRQHWIHFLPVVLEFIFSNFVKMQNFYWDGTRESLSWLGYNGYRLWEHTPFQLSIATLLIVFYGYQCRKILKSHQENIKVKSYQRLQNIIRLYLFFGIAILVSGIVDYLFFNFAFNPFYKYPTFISMTIVTYIIGMQAIWFRDKSIFLTKKKPIENEAQLKAVLEKVEFEMQENKRYLDAGLDVKTLAEHCDTKPYLLTKALNHLLEKKFSDYVNEYRVEEVKRRINDSKYSHQTLLGIGLDAGFNSKASFNRIVKKITGSPPSALKK